MHDSKQSMVFNVCRKEIFFSSFCGLVLPGGNIRLLPDSLSIYFAMNLKQAKEKRQFQHSISQDLSSSCLPQQ
jgi:hypothetical protein